MFSIIMVMLIFLLLFCKTCYSVDIEFNLNTTEIIEYWGYPVEIHTVTTVDGFILELHRIPHGRDNIKSPLSPEKPVIFLQHGLLCSSFEWVANRPDQSAGFVFADAGFDVWMGNFRGNTYSRKHLKYSPKEKEFWDWSWDQYVHIDLQSMIEKVLNVTKKDNLYYVGHSLGTLSLFAKLSKDPAFSKYIKSFFALAPIGTIKHIRGFFSYFGRRLGYNYQVYNNKNGPDEFFGRTWMFTTVVKYTCGLFDSIEELCSDAVELFVGPLNTYWNQTRVPVYLSHTPAGCSSNVVTHFDQMYSYGGIPAYDLGVEKNQQVYGQSLPPQYDFTLVRNVSIYLFWSEDDWLATKSDLHEYLFRVLDPKDMKQIIQIPFYNHLDFVWGTQAARDIYIPIINFIVQDLVNENK